MDLQEELIVKVDSHKVPMGGSHEFYEESARNFLHRHLPRELLLQLVQGTVSLSEKKNLLGAHLPLVSHTISDGLVSSISLHFIAPSRNQSSLFFLEILTQWLASLQPLSLQFLYTIDIQLPQLGQDGSYTLGEIVFLLEKEGRYSTIVKRLPELISDLKVGLTSDNEGHKILERRGVSLGKKALLIRERMARLMNRFPQTFGHNLFDEMRKTLALSSDTFQKERSVSHLTKIIALFYLFHKRLEQAVVDRSGKRNLHTKLFRCPLSLPIVNEAERTLQSARNRRFGLIVAMNLLADNESFCKRHLLRALKKHLPRAIFVEGSFLVFSRTKEFSLLYLEIEDRSKQLSSLATIEELSTTLSRDLFTYVERSMHHLVNPRNEEEIMRNIVELSSQIKFVRDLPQLFIGFDEQNVDELLFTVIILRVLKRRAPTLEELLHLSQCRFTFVIERCCIVGRLRKRHPKEATVLRVRVAKESFLREDHSIALYRARALIAQELSRAIGEMRDYNGGMISKQNELLFKLRALLKKEGEIEDVLLEDFFYAIDPVIMRSILDGKILQQLFLLMRTCAREYRETETPYHLLIEERGEITIAVVTTDFPLEESVSESLTRGVPVTRYSLTKSRVMIEDLSTLGFIFRAPFSDAQKLFEEKFRANAKKLFLEELQHLE